jgi:hypothetical protein
MLAYRAGMGFSPTIREIGEMCEISSTNGVVCHLKAIEAKGYISLGSGSRSRAIAFLDRCNELEAGAEDEALSVELAEEEATRQAGERAVKGGRFYLMMGAEEYCSEAERSLLYFLRAYVVGQGDRDNPRLPSLREIQLAIKAPTVTRAAEVLNDLLARKIILKTG